MSNRIELDAPDIGTIEKEQVCAAIDSGFVSSFGPWVGEFERQFAQLVGVPRAVAIQSGTAALHMALHVLGIKAGDEVILPSTTFAATLHAVMYVKATPVIVDVDRDTWCLSVDAFKAAITSKTKAVIPVHLYGNACDMEAITSIAAAKGIFVVEDATESLGALMSGRHLGTWGDMGCYSFNGNKLMTTGSGGMMVARSTDILERVGYLINQTNPREGMEGYQEVGFNYRMPNLNAALGIAQLSRFKGFIGLKKTFHQIYETQLEKSGLCLMQKTYPGAEPSWWFTAVLLKNAAEVLHVQKYLKNSGIPSRGIFKPLHTLGYAKVFQKGSCDNAQMLYERGLCLPSSTLNTEEMINSVCGAIKQALKLSEAKKEIN